MIADDGHVSTVAVDPARRGEQIATRLMVELGRGALRRGANQLTLEVRVSNTRAQAVYRRFGFVPAGARKAYYADNGEDALVMWAHDITAPEARRRLADVEASFPSSTVRLGFDEGSSAASPAAPSTNPVHPALHPAASVASSDAVDGRM